MANVPTLEELQERDAPVCTCAAIGFTLTPSDEDADPVAVEEVQTEVIGLLDKYLSSFAAPVVDESADGLLRGRYRCVRCGETLIGALGTFCWGIAHGEGFCSRCSYPARAIHYPKDEKGDDLFDSPLEMVLQYHPSVVESR